MRGVGRGPRGGAAVGDRQRPGGDGGGREGALSAVRPGADGGPLCAPGVHEQADCQWAAGGRADGQRSSQAHQVEDEGQHPHRGARPDPVGARDSGEFGPGASDQWKQRRRLWTVALSVAPRSVPQQACFPGCNQPSIKSAKRSLIQHAVRWLLDQLHLCSSPRGRSRGLGPRVGWSARWLG